jgi:ribonuclease BN (tRNA processing enzyme)
MASAYQLDGGYGRPTMGLAITVLGSSGTWPSATNGCSGYLVDDGTHRVWIDCGPGSFSALQQHCELADVNALVITHEHPDHCMELPVIRNAMRYGLGVERMPFYAPRGVLALLETLVGSRGITPSFEPKMIGDRSVARVGGMKLGFSRTDHPVETLAVRVEPDDGPGGAIVYSSDTGPGWSVGALGPDIALAVVEATFLAADIGESTAVHRTAAFTGEDGRASGVERLVLTHITPNGDPEAHRAEAAASFRGEVELARPHERFEVPR